MLSQNLVINAIIVQSIIIYYPCHENVVLKRNFLKDTCNFIRFMHRMVCFFKTQDILSPVCRRKKASHHKCKQNIAMKDCLQAGYSKTSQSVIAIIIFVFMVSSVFWRLQSGLSISRALEPCESHRSYCVVVHALKFTSQNGQN